MSRIRPVGAPIMNIQSTLRTAPDLCENVSLRVLFGSDGNSYAVSIQIRVCVWVYIYIYTRVY